MYRDRGRYSVEMLNILLDDNSCDQFYNMDGTSQGWSILYTTNLTCLNTITPWKEVRNVKPTSDWTTPELLPDLRKRDRLKTG